MRKIALIICVLMIIIMPACAANNKDIDNNNGPDGGDKIINDNNAGKDNTGANLDNNDMAEEETLKGSAEGYGGEVTVTVKVKGNDIISVEAMGKDETEGVGSIAIEELPDKIAQADSTDIDGISGATFTSNAIKEAVSKALDGARR